MDKACWSCIWVRITFQDQSVDAICKNPVSKQYNHEVKRAQLEKCFKLTNWGKL